MMRREVPGVLSARYRSPQCRGGRAISAAGTGMCRVARQDGVAGASSVTSDAAACGADAVRRQAFRERCGARWVARPVAVAGASSVTRDAATCGVDAVRRGVQEAVAGASSCGAGAVRRRALGDSVAGVTLVTRWGTGLVWALGPVPGAELTR